MNFFPLLFILSIFHLPQAEIQVGEKKLKVHLAKTDQARERGLMFVDSIKDDEGMLFVYEKPEVVSFWMKNTKISLSIGFFDEKKRLIQIEQMKPCEVGTIPSRVYTSHRPISFALEVNEGWFEKNQIPLEEYLKATHLH